MSPQRNIFQLFIIFIVLLFCMNIVTSSQTKNGSKTVLVVYGGWEGHEPKECKDVFVPWLEQEGYKVIQSESLEVYSDSTIMNSIDLVVQTVTMAEITNEQEQGLVNAVMNGVSIAGWHGGLGDSFRKNTGYQFMVGGQFVAHPGGQIEYLVNIINKDDPIMKDLNDFKITSEQYYMHVDPANNVLATTTFSGEHSEWIEGTVMPVVWKKKYGKGKVFYSSLAHSASDFNIPEVLTIMKRGILWAMDEL